ncbi:MAG: 16S rRNA (cytidine(1402)-2'-O)-methyltransferase [Patescibacteria group bacterium]
MRSLYIIATPIGNLKDITLRALEILKSVDFVLAEDTRVTQKLLNHYEIKARLLRYDENIAETMNERVGAILKQDKVVALVTDAGTPAISDPGARLVEYVVNYLPSVKVIPIPGPSALIAALSASGINANQFTFLGYSPHKKGRETFFKELKKIETRPVVFYESPHRLEKTFLALQKNLSENYEIIVVKEITKIHEEIWRGSVKTALAYFQNAKAKGEFVIIIP